MPRSPYRAAEQLPGRETYVVAIDDIAPMHNFLANASEGDPGAFKDRFQVEIVGTLQAPGAIRGSRCTIRLFGNRTVTNQLSDPKDEDYKPDDVGDLSLGPEGGQYQGLYPQDALFHVAILIAQGLLKCVELKGLPLQSGRASIDDISFRLISVYAAA